MEVSVIKKAREVAKGKVTRNIYMLDSDLSQDERERFIFDQIEANSIMYSSYDTFQELHDRYLEYADLKDDEEESDYLKNIAYAFSAAKRKYIKHKS